MALAAPVLLTKGFGPTSKYVDVTGAEHSGYKMSNDLINQYVLQAVDAGKAAGASFVDARITRMVYQGMQGNGATDREIMNFGVRAFVDGVWGFSASSLIEMDEGVFLAEAAVSQAKINSVVFPREIDLGKYPAVKGEWSTPVRIDPFSIPIDEKADFLSSFNGIGPRYNPNESYGGSFKDVGMQRIEKVIATSEGSLYKQTLYEIDGVFIVKGKTHINDEDVEIEITSPDIYKCGSGWEMFLDANLREKIPELFEQGKKDLAMYSEPVQVGRYELVVSAGVAASFVASTLANATQLDRIMGYEANAGGTSYLGPDYKKSLGAVLGVSQMNVRADRTMSRGLATTKWDDEGVEAGSFDLVKDGKLVDYQTDREMSSFMPEWYASQGREVKSNGCSRTDSASTIPLVHTPNLTLLPGKGAKTFADMVASTERGLAFIAGGVGTDFQSRTGHGGGYLREIRKGVLGPALVGAQPLFDSMEIWKSLLEVGDGTETGTTPVPAGKGQPGQNSNYTIKSVPLRFKDVAVVDGTRK